MNTDKHIRNQGALLTAEDAEDRGDTQRKPAEAGGGHGGELFHLFYLRHLRHLRIILFCGFVLLAFVVSASAQVPQNVAGKLSEESRYWWARAVGTTARNPAHALVVSRHQFENLRALRSWQDLSALRDYVEWADRAEAAGVSDSQVIADVSTNDLVLLRVPFNSVTASVKVLRDPIGYAVLDPRGEGSLACPAANEKGPKVQGSKGPRVDTSEAGSAGNKRICLKLAPTTATIPDLPAGLPLAPVPLINAAVRAGPEAVTVYGASLAGSRVRIFSRKGEGKILYAGANQINASVPSVDEVCVEIDGLKSDWAEVQK